DARSCAISFKHQDLRGAMFPVESEDRIAETALRLHFRIVGKGIVDPERPALFLEAGQNSHLITSRLAKTLDDQMTNPQPAEGRVPGRFWLGWSGILAAGMHDVRLIICICKYITKKTAGVNDPTGGPPVFGPPCPGERSPPCRAAGQPAAVLPA